MAGPAGGETSAEPAHFRVTFYDVMMEHELRQKKLSILTAKNELEANPSYLALTS